MKLSNCCDAPVTGEDPICSKCGEHCDVHEEEDNVRELIKLAYWETVNMVYKKGTSDLVNAVICEDLDLFIENIFKKITPTCPNCRNKMKYFGVAFECRCGMVKSIK